MRIAVAREVVPGEARVALVPELLGKLRSAGYEVAVQTGAGVGAFHTDAAYEAAGALVTEHPFDQADLVLSVHRWLDAPATSPCAATGRSQPSEWNTCRGSPAPNPWMH